MKTYPVTSKSWARLPKKLPGNFFKLLRSPKPLGPIITATLGHVWTRPILRLTLEEFKKKLDGVMKPMGFRECTVHYDFREWRVIVHMSHKYPPEHMHVSVWKELDCRIVRPETLADLPKIEVIEPEIWSCQYKISEECFQYDDNKQLLQRCARFAVDEFTHYQLSKV